MDTAPKDEEFNIDAAVSEILTDAETSKAEIEQCFIDYYQTATGSMVELQKLAASLGFFIPEEYRIDESTSADTFHQMNETIVYRFDEFIPDYVRTIALALEKLVTIKQIINEYDLCDADIEHRNDTIAEMLISPLVDEEQKTAFVKLANEYLKDVIEPLVITANFVQDYEEREEASGTNVEIRSVLRKMAKNALREAVGERDQISHIAMMLIFDAIGSYPKYLHTITAGAEQNSVSGVIMPGPAEATKDELSGYDVLRDIEKEVELTLETKRKIIDSIHKAMHVAGYRTDLGF